MVDIGTKSVEFELINNFKTYTIRSPHTRIRYNAVRGVPLVVKDPRDVEYFRQRPDVVVEVGTESYKSKGGPASYVVMKPTKKDRVSPEVLRKTEALKLEDVRKKTEAEKLKKNKETKRLLVEEAAKLEAAEEKKAEEAKKAREAKEVELREVPKQKPAKAKVKKEQ